MKQNHMKCMKSISY